MKLKALTYAPLVLLVGVAVAVPAPGFHLVSLSVSISISAVEALAMLPRQESEDTMDLYLCSNPDFNHDCVSCACERLANLTTSGGYGPPPCYPLPDDLRVGNPQGVSSARSYSKWNCTLYDNAECNGTLPGSSINIPLGPPGLVTLGAFDDRAVSYQCRAIR